MKQSIRQRGFTLVEVLVALAILAIAVVALINLQLTSMKLSDRSQRTSEAAALARAKLAEIAGRESVPVGRSSGTAEGAGGMSYSWSATVAELDDAALAAVNVTAMRSVAVEVLWPDGQATRRVQFNTWVRDRTQAAHAP